MSPAPRPEASSSLVARRPLAMEDAVELCSAWLSHLARRHGIRALIIKGPSLKELGLRDRRVSSDVDVLVEPARFDELIRHVESAGWRRFATTLQQEQLTRHSITLFRDGWPNSVDIHRHYPGMLRDEDEVFDVLWHRRTTARLAHTGCETPDRVSHALILALHSLRSVVENPRHGAELESLQRAEFSDDERRDLAAVAVATGSAEPLREVLERLGVDLPLDEEMRDSDAFRQWRWKVTGVQGSAAQATVAGWIAAIRRAPWREKVRLAWRAVWPRREDILLAVPGTADTLRTVNRERLARLGRGIRALPRLLLNHRRARRRDA